MSKLKGPSIISAAPGEMPFFVRAKVLAGILGVSRDCIYWRVAHQHLTAFDLDLGTTKGWLLTTLDEKEPALMQIVRKFYDAQKVVA